MSRMNSLDVRDNYLTVDYVVNRFFALLGSGKDKIGYEKDKTDTEIVLKRY